MSSDSDLTARARIRDAAIALFTERGVAGATIRDIAQAAGVSSGLLRHHFGSKEGLRDACDEYALSRIAQVQTRFIESRTLAPIPPDVLHLQQYLIRALMDGSPRSTEMFRQAIDHGERLMAGFGLETSDLRAFVAVLGAMKMGMFLMRDQLTAVLGEDVGVMPGYLRLLRASVEIFSQSLLTPEQADQALKALDRLATQEGEL
ncbi:TetR/AcrR family transcriptional regulator [Actinoplanes regularis]|uniref:Transcriptional regulator, TetR family n=1 Tax=Actinoplanes regularis TaxID=52697 RepID=A0A238X3T6_9ACTN|nr:TetR/AcrR family transcriptional regulator [Actinoplanes regularis]GIE86389.1 TetR family transcriptional regulator [Actinoplanes regularis]GLW33515.1 TetR family transcriptional regulator [Actinoplanes regularis]SNR53238.1 transcriptional regulator, TetR family [Actinoplanes regularis]